MASEETSKGTEKQAQEKPATAERIDEVDRLRVNNCHLRHILRLQEQQTLSQQIQLLQFQVQTKVQEAEKVAAEIMELRKEFAEKYNIDFNHYMVREEDGVVVPRGTPTSGLGNALLEGTAAKIAGKAAVS